MVNGLLQRGGRKDRLEAKLFGGARTLEGLSDIGARNAAFAERFLKNEEISLYRRQLGRRQRAARPVLADIRARPTIDDVGNDVPLIAPPLPSLERSHDGDVEFF